MDAKKETHRKLVQDAAPCPCTLLLLQQTMKQAGCLPIKVSKHLVVAKLLAFLVLVLFLLPLRTLCVYTDYIDPGFSASAMSYVDSNGVFLYSLSSGFSVALYTFSGEASVYLSVIHTSSHQIVWTANRDSPASSSDKFFLTPGGNALLMHGNGSNVLWSTNTTGRGATKMQMQDTGNLVLLDAQNNTVWQSFDYPTDTLLTGQVLRMQASMKLVSSTSDTNMSSGPYSLSLESGDLHLLFSANSSSALPYWSMLRDTRLVTSSSGAPSYAVLNSTGLSLVRNDTVVISLFNWNSNALLCRATLQIDGNLHIYVFSSNVWALLFTALTYSCDLPLYCGHLGLCNGEQCSCPSSLQPLNRSNITQGCQGPSTAPCTKNSSASAPSHFEKIGDGLEYFANQYILPVRTSGLDPCKQLCAQDCSCSFLFYYNESGYCYLFPHLGTIQSTSRSGHALYVRTTGFLETPKQGTPPETASQEAQGLPSFVLPVIVGGSAFIIIAMISFFIYWYIRVRRITLPDEDYADDDIFLGSIPGFPTRFSFKELQSATNNFSKKLGTGGFGSVYEGFLPDKTKVAVKQLESVGQGKKEFRAEVAIIGNIHHVHLVQLRGFCAEGLHRLLVYEFMSNSSLDKCLFVNGENTQVLDWNIRYRIALGTARGLAYLHDDCREKIIHCDIKPENILLDENFNAKVSDFGMAKLLNKEQSQVFTTMRGTRGYLAPEWLMNLAISEKSDVYSFGMVLLEIISGRKNYEPSETSEKRYFPAYVFEQAEHGCLEQIVDERLRGTVNDDKVIEVVRLALWCIQEETQLRPSMARVVQMLEGNVRVFEPPLSSQFAVRLHARMVESMNSSQQTSSASERNNQALLSAVQLSAPR